MGVMIEVVSGEWEGRTGEEDRKDQYQPDARPLTSLYTRNAQQRNLRTSIKAQPKHHP